MDSCLQAAKVTVYFVRQAAIFLASAVMLELPTSCEAWTMLQPLQTDPEYPVKCVIRPGDEEGVLSYSSTSKVLSVGDVIFPDNPALSCTRATCTAFRGQMALDIAGCGVVEPGPGCRLVTDPSQNYLSCCPRPVCDKEVPRRRLDVYDYSLWEDDLLAMETNSDEDESLLQNQLPR